MVGKSVETDYTTKSAVVVIDKPIMNIDMDMSKRNSVVESREGSEYQSKMDNEDKNISALKFSKSQISMDSIPLNWGKHPLIQPILKIVSLCMGPYGMNNNFSMLKTHKVFKEIHLIACQNYWSHFGKLDPNFELVENYSGQFNQLLKEPEATKASQNRLKSAVLNNQGIIMFLSITEDTY
jgi:hypothetical protein